MEFKTGFNDAFIVDQETRDVLVAEDPKSAELLKPVLRGRDIARYRANWAGLWLISTFPSLNLNIDAYPAIKQHLLSFGKARLAQEGRQLPGGVRSRKKTPNAWYELQDTCAYHKEFHKEKLFWMHMAPHGRFALGEPNVVCNQKCFMITGNHLNYLCAVLNSALVTWLVKHTAVTTGMGLPQWDKFTVEEVPIVPLGSSTNTMRWFHCVVQRILEAIAGGNSQEVNQLQRAIDHKVFSLYGLNPEERKCVTSAVTSPSSIF